MLRAPRQGPEDIHEELSFAAKRVFRAKFESLAIRKGKGHKKKSIIALTHKMLRTIYAMLAPEPTTRTGESPTKP